MVLGKTGNSGEGVGELNIRNLLTVKSLVTLLLTIVFGVISVADFVINKEVNSLFITVYPVIIGWYFGSQETKKNQTNNAE